MDLKKQKKIEKMQQDWSDEKQFLEIKKQIKNEKHNIKRGKISTSKLLILFLFLNCTLIEIFTGWAIAKMLYIALTIGGVIDFSPLIALIGAVVGEVMGYAVYSIKAAKENTVGGVVYESTLKKYKEQSIDEDI